MKTNRIYIILFVLLASASAYFYFTRSDSTIRKELRDFAVKDTASISRIFMADRQGKTVLLERINAGEWKVNNRFTARQDAVNTLLETVNGLEVRSPVGKNLYNNTMKLLSSNSVKVELYSGDELLKTFYVGHSTMDNLGTFMYLEGSSVPFIMHIPGFNGYLTPRFFTNENDWRQRSVFAFQPAAIKAVEVTDAVYPDSSFSINKVNDSTYRVSTAKGLINPVKGKVIAFLSSFSNINYEKIDDTMTKHQQDSIVQAGAFKSIKVEGNVTTKATLYRRPITASSLSKTDAEGKPLPFDMDRLYVKLDGDTTWYICQYFSWSKLLKTPAFFMEGFTASK